MPVSVVDDRERVGARRAQRDARGRVVAAGPDVAARASARSSGSTAARSSACVAEQSRGPRRRAAPRTRPRARARRARAGSRGRGSPPRRAGRAASRGSRMKYWSSASSLATSTASPCPRRPARPHCWRRLATVPGKPTEITQSSSPMSIPSSSASVARDAEQLARDEPPLDLAPLRRRVAGAVRARARRGRRPSAVGGEAVDQLGRLAALREAERPQAARDELGHQPRRLAERAARAGRAPRRAAAGSRARSSARRAAPRRRRSTVDVDAEQRARELARVRDRRRGEQELRLGAVDAREPAQAPEHVADVRAEDAAVDVRLVDDDVARGSRARRPSGRGAAGRRRGACPGS